MLDNETLTIILGLLFSASELLAKIPYVKANSVFEAVQNVIKDLKARNKSDDD